MQRYFIAESVAAGEQVELTGETAHHIQRVMRAQVGDQIELVTAQHHAYRSTIESTQPDSVRVRLGAVALPDPELPNQVIIACSIAKKDKADWIVQKGTELGASGFIFFSSQYGIAKWEPQRQAKKLARLQKIALEAARQSHRAQLPTVAIIPGITELTQVAKDHGVVAYEESAKQGETAALVATAQQMQDGQTLIAVFGPEGGLAPTEVAQLTAANFVPAGLGPRILRAETAPLYLLSALSTLWELR
ncbi:16S rRNA (uracil(1498)-N(3))-methyltransferase [Loigolactobacillus zhaoyuanensis]|uniref:16S rRNA (uracil(1498)-N(3))-methyltransferase n=1 Tax=Loigolactobacillus zhaoyuanensis TaxID=2486017 RepID=UPI000F746FF0|nr:16S rRNA (uracil(1498)-N(3))-methyltransferase [Loigolactobacillus zhaoyuanensis]